MTFEALLGATGLNNLSVVLTIYIVPYIFIEYSGDWNLQPTQRSAEMGRFEIGPANLHKRRIP
jgi:hypothetical protein